MKSIFVFCGLMFFIHYKVAEGRYRISGSIRCVNMWDEGCINGQLPGSGKDDNYVNGGFNPGKRCVNMWDEGCVNGQLPGSGRDDDFVNGGFNPGKRCINEWDTGCDSGNFGNNNIMKNGFQSGKRYDLNFLYKLYKNAHNN